MKILAIDGGGVRGCIASTILVEIEHRVGQLNKHFDLIAGTSAGAIIAAAIACGYDAAAIADFYRESVRVIFPYQSLFSLQRLPLLFKHGIDAPKYDSSGIEALTKQLFADRCLVDIASPKLMIPAFDTQRRQPLFFKSWQTERHKGLTLSDAVLASSAAPTYFPGRKLVLNGETYSAIDGGIHANDPTLCAIAEAIRLGAPLEEIEVVSVGTGDPTSGISLEEAADWGIVRWMSHIVDLLLESPGSTTCYLANQLLGHRYLRLQFKLNRGLTQAPLSSEIDNASEENVANLVAAAQAYIKNVDTQYKLWRFFS